MISYVLELKDGAVISDMGCGEAELARRVKESKRDITVHSFDLVSANEFITAADISNVPLEDSGVDVVIFCLSLMGTNYLEFIMEANRILKVGGILKIAEIESRFVDIDLFTKTLEKSGFQMAGKNLEKMFYFFDFKKKKDAKGKVVKNELLKPCLYKKR
jgi:ubiquinone/menaquinone biosynthesis C-methylase UbiE